jgi:UDP-N-acetylmuramyl pentapeptide phosphotransferase/UDP-N-acetylglucosamine-1-phosphate transferase
VFEELAGSAAIAALVSLVVCRIQMRAGPVDAADETHKAHTLPTPTSGGIGIALGYTAGLVAMAQLFTPTDLLNRQGEALVSMASAIAFTFLLIGFIDDTRPIGPRLKFLLFALLSIGSAITMGIVDSLPIRDGETVRLGLSLGLFGTALWVFVLVNCVNFMDGANGLAMGSMVVGLIALGAIGYASGSNTVLAMTLCAAAALIGFLVWNFPHGKIFAGDSGALFAGAIAAIASLILIARHDLSPFIPPILFMPLLADALLTLAWRVRHRRKLLVGHQEHFYQVLMRAGWSHARVSLLYWGVMALCGVIGYALSRAQDVSAPWVALAAAAGLSLAVSIFVRKFARTHGMSSPKI